MSALPDTRANVILALASTALCLVFAELALRVSRPDPPGVGPDLHRLGYLHDPELGWFPVPHATHPFVASRATTVTNNARGFRDTEHRPDRRPGLLVLGDSFVWGYDVEADERFTDRLAHELPSWQVFNAGVCGYGTDQELLLLGRHIAFYHPRIVLLTFCTDNDFQDNAANVRYGGAFKPYFAHDGANLSLRGVPVPRSVRFAYQSHPILYRIRLARLMVETAARVRDPPARHVDDPTRPLLLAVRHLAEAHGAELIVGLQDRHPPLEEFLLSSGIPALDFSPAERYPDHGRHWTPAGHATVCAIVRASLPTP